jgi:hypothetical protein
VCDGVCGSLQFPLLNEFAHVVVVHAVRLGASLLSPVLWLGRKETLPLPPPSSKHADATQELSFTGGKTMQTQ